MGDGYGQTEHGPVIHIASAPLQVSFSSGGRIFNLDPRAVRPHYAIPRPPGPAFGSARTANGVPTVPLEIAI